MRAPVVDDQLAVDVHVRPAGGNRGERVEIVAQDQQPPLHVALNTFGTGGFHAASIRLVEGGASTTEWTGVEVESELKKYRPTRPSCSESSRFARPSRSIRSVRPRTTRTRRAR